VVELERQAELGELAGKVVAVAGVQPLGELLVDGGPTLIAAAGKRVPGDPQQAVESMP